MATREEIESRIAHYRANRERAVNSDYPELYWNGDEAEKLRLLEWVLED